MRDCLAWISDRKEDSVSESRVVIAVGGIQRIRGKERRGDSHDTSSWLLSATLLTT